MIVKFFLSAGKHLCKAVSNLLPPSSLRDELPGDYKVKDAVPIGTITEERDAIIITKIHGDIDGAFTADFYLGRNDEIGFSCYTEVFFTGQNLTLSELNRYDIYAYGDDREAIYNEPKPFVR